MSITDPRDISGLLAWYSADHAATVYADDVPIDTWTDLSGNGNHATGTTTPGAGVPVKPRMKSTAGASGGPAIDFTVTNSGGFFTLPNIFSGVTAAETMMSVKADATSLNGMWTMGPFPGGGDGNYYPHLGIVYNSFGLPSGHRQSFTPTLSINAWRRLNAWSASSDWATLLDGVSQATYAGATPAFPAAPLLGTASAGGGQVDTFDGQVGCLVVYGRKLTTGERADLDAWLAANPSGGTAAPAAGSISLAGAVQRETASFTLTAAALVALAGTMQRETATFDLTAVTSADVALAGTMRRETAAFDLDAAAPSSVLLAATEQRETAAVTLLAVGSADREVAFAGIEQGEIAQFRAYAVTPIVDAPILAAQHAYVVAQAFGPVSLVNGTQPSYAISDAQQRRATTRILMDNKDVTYWRNTLTPHPRYTLVEPMLYGPATIDFPQVAACFGDTPGQGDLYFMHPGATVEVQRILDGAIIGTDYVGVVTDYDISGRNLTVNIGGELQGRAELVNRQQVIFPRINDLGHQIADSVRDLGIQHSPPLGAVTGIEMMTSGGVGHLEHLQGLVSMAHTRSGAQWTVMPDKITGIYETHRKDVTTINGTVFLDDAKTVGNLRRDISEEPNRIFVTCVTPAGQRIRFGVYPGLIQGPVPEFPGHMEAGDTGEGVRLLIGKLHAVNYIKLKDVAGGYDSDVVEAVKALQDDAGLTQTGEVNEQTWNALYDLGITGQSLEWAAIQPAAQRSKVRKFNRSGTGTILGFNPDYEPDRLKRDRNIDLGPGITRDQAREFAKTVLHDSDDPNWTGTIAFHTGALIKGEGAEGMTVASADVMDARRLKPGMNLWLPQFDGGTLVHISAIEVTDSGLVTATVDTRARDALEVWEVIARNRESRNDPTRHRIRKARSSTMNHDSIGIWDEIGGLLGQDVNLDAGWNAFQVVGAAEGTIARIRIILDNPAEFAVAVFGRSTSAKFLNDLVPSPLSKAGEKQWDTHRDALNDHGILYSAGTRDEPCGYYPGRKTYVSTTDEVPNPDYDPTADENTTGTDDQEFITVTTEEAVGTLTGKHRDDASWRYASEDRTKLHILVYVRTANTIEAGRILWPQLESGV